VTITALSPSAEHAARVDVHVDGAFRLTLAADVVFAAGLRVGDDLTPERQAELERQDGAWRAREAALSLLSHRQRTAKELARRLAGKGHDAAVAGEVVERLEDVGLVDDDAFARAFVRDRVRLKPKGRRVLQQELRAKGVSGETARAAIDGVLEAEETDDLALARQAAARWRPRPGEDPRRARARLHGFLARRGFGGDALRAVLAERLADPDGTQGDGPDD
jgi:regulatory protein